MNERQKYYEENNITTKVCDECGFAHGDHECFNPN